MPDRMSGTSLFTRSFVFCALANLFQGLAFNLFLHFPGFLSELGAGEVQIGLIFGLTALVSIGLRPTVGVFMDTRGRRGVILFGNVLNVAVLGLYLTVVEISIWIYVVRVLHGFAEALLFTSLFTYAADQVPERRLTQGLALFGVTGMLPISLGGVLGDVVLAWSGYDALFLLSLAFAVVALAFALPLRDAPRPEHHDSGTESRGFLAALGQPDLLPLWWIATIFAIALASIFTFLKTYVMETGIGSIGGFFTAYTAVALVFRVFLGWLPDRIGPKRALYPALAALAAGFLLLSRAETAAGVALAGVMCGVGHGSAFPIMFGLVVSRARVTERGSAMAIYTGLFDVGVLVGGPSLGLVISLWGYSSMFATAGALVAFGSTIFAWWDRRR